MGLMMSRRRLEKARNEAVLKQPTAETPVVTEEVVDVPQATDETPLAPSPEEEPKAEKKDGTVKSPAKQNRPALGVRR